MASPESLFAERLAADRARPLVTFYDERTGERAELSAASLANWVAKTYYLLTEDLLVEPGELALVDLPMHWMRYVVLLGSWYAGLTVTEDHGATARVAFTHTGVELPGEDVFSLALAPWGQGYPGPPPAGTADFVAEVRPQPDAFASIRAIGLEQDATPGIRREQLAAGASAAAPAGGARLLLRDDRQADLAAWLAPLVGTGSIVLVAGATDPAVERIAAAERVGQ